MDLKLISKKKLMIIGGIAAVSIATFLFLWKRKRDPEKPPDVKLLDAKKLLKIYNEVWKRINAKMIQLVKSHRKERRELLANGADMSTYTEACKQFEASCYELIENAQNEYIESAGISKHTLDMSVKAALEAKDPTEAEIAFKHLSSNILPVYLKKIPPTNTISLQEAREMIKARAEFFKSQLSTVASFLPKDLSAKGVQHVLGCVANDYTWEKTKFEYEDLAPLIAANMQMMLSLIEKETDGNKNLSKFVIHGLHWPTA